MPRSSKMTIFHPVDCDISSGSTIRAAAYAAGCAALVMQHCVERGLEFSLQERRDRLILVGAWRPDDPLHSSRVDISKDMVVRSLLGGLNTNYSTGVIPICHNMNE
jgi:hypothetical protein